MNNLLDRNLRSSITSLKKLLFTPEELCVPGYQRPYKWSARNVNQLIDDILQNTRKSAYRLGSVVLHRQDGLNIVDGQQRLLTLSILAAELLELDFLAKDMTAENLALANHKVTDPISLKNLRRNHAIIRSRVREFKPDQVAFFFEKCELVQIELNDISEAFQFFDGQNSRGLDLKPHDLLKAFHLREMSAERTTVLHKSVALWEANIKNLQNYFANYFFKIKKWSQGRYGLDFSKNDINIFKGIKITKGAVSFPFDTGLRMIHSNHSGLLNDYPFQIDQPITNGRRFFEFVDFYAKRIEEIRSLSIQTSKPNDLINAIRKNPLAANIIDVLNRYKGRNRRGDGYLRNLLDCCLLYYIDRFGLFKVDEAFIRFFFWAYALRLEKTAVKEITVDSLARQGDGYFRLIRDAVQPSDLLQREIMQANYVGNRAAVANIEEIVALFIENHVTEHKS